MIQLPPDFSAAALLGEFYTLAAPFVGVALIIAAGFVLSNILRRA